MWKDTNDRFYYIPQVLESIYLFSLLQVYSNDTPKNTNIKKVIGLIFKIIKFFMNAKPRYQSKMIYPQYGLACGPIMKPSSR